jgi:glycosyltransferase involved in cell wall biosynthesis
MFRIFALFILSFTPLLLRAEKSIDFAIVIPSYNNEKWVIGNLESALSQDWPTYKVYYIDDCSEDKTGALAEEYIKKNAFEKRCQIFHNRERKGGLANFYAIIHSLNPKTIVLCLDGDDQLISPSVLKTLARVYSNPKIWLTWGNYIADPYFPSACAPIPRRVAREGSFRSYTWVSSHLKTFRAKLFQLIKKEDLMTDGRFLSTNSDQAMMFPMLEMAAQGHFKFIRKPLYIYNRKNINRVGVKHHAEQLRNEKIIREKAPYLPLESLFEN